MSDYTPKVTDLEDGWVRISSTVTRQPSEDYIDAAIEGIDFAQQWCPETHDVNKVTIARERPRMRDGRLCGSRRIFISLYCGKRPE